jgi:hypothetical protein
MFVSDHWLATGMWLSLTSSTNKTDHHAYDITDILLKVALNIITNMSKNVIEISVERGNSHFFFFQYSANRLWRIVTD